MSFERANSYLQNLMQMPPEEIDAEMALKLAYYALSDGRKASGRALGELSYHSLPQMVAALTGVCAAAREIYDSQIIGLSGKSASDSLKEKLLAADQSLEAIRAGTDPLSGELKKLEEKEAELDRARAEKQKALDDEKERLSKRRRELDEQLSEKERAVEDQRKENGTAEKKIAEKERERLSLTEELTLLEQQLAALTETVEKAREASGQTANLSGRLDAFKRAVGALFRSNVSKNGLEQQGKDPAQIQMQLMTRIEEAQSGVDRLKGEVTALIQSSEALTQERAVEKPVPAKKETQPSDSSAEPSAQEPPKGTDSAG